KSQSSEKTEKMKALLLYSLNSKGLKMSNLTNTDTPNKISQRSKFEESLLESFTKQKVQEKGPSIMEDPFEYLDDDDIDKYTREVITKIRNVPRGKVVDISNINSTGAGMNYIVSPNTKQKAIGLPKIQSP